MYQKQISFPCKLKRYTIASCWLVVSIRHFVLSIYYRHGILICLMSTHWLTPNYITIFVFFCPYVCLSLTLWMSLFLSIYVFVSQYLYLVVLMYTIILTTQGLIQEFLFGRGKNRSCKIHCIGVLGYVPPGNF